MVVLKNPKLEGDRLTFDVDVLEGDLAGADGAASLFIDIIGRPFTPLSFAAWRAAPPFVAPITPVPLLSAQPPSAPLLLPPVWRLRLRHAPPPPACGYYPYPPCY